MYTIWRILAIIRKRLSVTAFQSDVMNVAVDDTGGDKGGVSLP